MNPFLRDYNDRKGFYGGSNYYIENGSNLVKLADESSIKGGVI